MTKTVQTPPYTLGFDDKVAHVLVYTSSALTKGEIVVKQLIRVSTWLRTNTAPDRLWLYNAKALSTVAGAAVKPASFTELYIPTSKIQAFHLLPPDKDPPDYDPSEPNRHMQPTSLLVANFRIDGHLRLAYQTTVGTFLEITRETFSSIYDARISCPQIPSMAIMSVPFVLVRQEACIFAIP